MNRRFELSMTRYQLYFAIIVLLVVIGGVVAINRLTHERRQVSSQAVQVEKLQQQTAALQSVNKALLKEIVGVYRTRIASCELNNARWTGVHQFLRTAIRARKRSGDVDIAEDYEAIDALIWPLEACSVLIPSPEFGG